MRVRFAAGLRRRAVEALSDLTIEVQRGDCFALVGPNGAGKSTALYCFLGLIRPDSGRVLLLGETPRPGAELFRRVAYLPEEPHYHLHLTVAEGLAFYGSLLGRRPDPAAIDRLLRRFDLFEAKDRKLAKCSKGMRQKFGFANCLLGEPDVLLLDEPTRGLDPIVVHEVRRTISELLEAGTTVVMNTHLLTEVEQLANRVAILDHGRVVVQDELRNLTTIDRETYEVEIEGEGEASFALDSASRSGNVIRGTVPVAGLAPLLSSLEPARWRLNSAQLRRRSLEECLLATVARNGGDDA